MNEQFTLLIQYRSNSQKGGASRLDRITDEISIDGIFNAGLLFDTYRENGHNTKIHSLILKNSKGEKIKKINFKYNIDK